MRFILRRAALKFSVSTGANLNQLRFENKSSAGWDCIAGTLAAVCQFGWNDEASMLADAHAQQSLVPAFNYLTGANGERQRLAAWNATIKLGAIF